MRQGTKKYNHDVSLPPEAKLVGVDGCAVGEEEQDERLLWTVQLALAAFLAFPEPPLRPPGDEGAA